MCMRATALVWSSQDNLEVALSCHVGSRDQVQVIKYGGKHPYLLSHLSDSVSPMSSLLGNRSLRGRARWTGGRAEKSHRLTEVGRYLIT